MEETTIETLQEELCQLRDALSRQEQDALGYLEQIKRLQADFENWRKRVEQEKLLIVENANASLAGKLLPVLDNFELALKRSPAGDPSFKDGMNLIYRQTMDLLKDEGLTAIEAIHQKFDPKLHEAFAYEERSKGEDHEIIEEVRKGYLFKGTVLRPALVKVVKILEPKNLGG